MSAACGGGIVVKLSSSGHLMRHRADLRTMALLFLLTLLYAWHFSGGSHWLLLPCTVLAVTACAAKHNHIHCATFRRRWANRLFDFWLAFLTGSTTTGIRVAHQVRHHGRNQSPDDPVRVDLVADKSAWHALIAFVPIAIRESWRDGHCARSVGRNQRVLNRILLQERSMLWILIAAGLIADWRRFLLTFPLAWLGSQWFLIAMNLPQHDGCDANDALSHSRNVTGDTANWLFLNNGFHTAHHERPSLHWSLIPAWHHKYLAGRVPIELENRTLTGMWLSWWKYKIERRS